MQKKALKILKSRAGFDRIIEQYAFGDCVDFVVSCGGDVIQYRVNTKTGSVSIR